MGPPARQPRLSTHLSGISTMKALAFFLALLLVAPASLAQVPPPQTDAAPAEASVDIVSTLDAAGTFSILVDALRDTGLADALASGETYTIFAPTDEAFQQLPAGTLDGLNANELTDLLRYHVLVGAVSSGEAAGLSSAPTVQGDALSLTTTGDALTVNGAVVTEADLEASNGVIHVIGTVLTPEPTREQERMEDQDRMEERMEHDEMSGESTPDAERISTEENVSDSPAETDDER